MLTSATTRRTLVYITYAALIHVVIYVGFRQTAFRSSDFASLYAAGSVVAAGRGAELYRPDGPGTGVSVPQTTGAALVPDRLHVPFELAGFAIFAQLPYTSAYTLWFFFNSALVIGTPALLRKRLPAVARDAGLMAIGCAAFFPAMTTLVQGQDSVILLAVLCAVFLALSDRRNGLAGLLLSLAMFKFQIALAMLLGLAALRGRRLLAGFAAGCAGLLAVSVIAVGPTGTLDYPRMLLGFSKLPAGSLAVSPWMMPNLRGFVFNFFPGIAPSWRLAILIVLSGLFLALQFWLGRRFRECREDLLPLVFSMMLVTATLVPFHEYTHDLTVLLLPLCLAWNHIASRPRSGPVSLLTVAAIFICVLPYIVVAARLMFVPVLLLWVACAVELLAEARQPAPQLAQAAGA